MEEKKEILESILPLAVLKAMTPIAEQSVAKASLVDGLVPIRHFPFRVGRESRVKIIDGRVERIERVKASGVTPNNDLYLVDDGHLLNISREHFQIERNESKFFLYDRGSACGTVVSGQGVGGKDSDETIELKDGDIITIGTRQSPYVFAFILLEGYEIREKQQL